MNKFNLKRQFKQAGSSKTEADSLSKLADNISNVLPSLDPQIKQEIAQQIGFKPVRNIPKLRLGLAGATAVFAILIVSAQSALPGSVLYALKRGSEEIRVIVQPGFNQDDLNKRREDEQDKLRQKADDSSNGETEDRSGKSSNDDIEGRSGSDSGKNEETKLDNSDSGSNSSGSSSGDSSGSGSSGSDSGSGSSKPGEPNDD